ncbi:MAG: hypothetical protein IJ466_06045 [Clostridia bacterium]|nr:hypothetical protein [Clostridia bacterium]
MKRILSCVLIAAMLICCAAAYAEVPKLSENMFKYAKNTLACLATGAYDKIVTSVPFSDLSPSADEWASFAEGSFESLRGAAPQKKYAVAYWTGRCWEIAVPVSAPESGDVEALILATEDGRSFSGYGYAEWEDIREDYQDADYVQWDEEYNGSTSVIIEFNED